MNYQLKKVELENVVPVYWIIEECGLYLNNKLGLGHWQPPYPIELMRKDVKEREVYSVYDVSDLVATFTISTKPLDYYYNELWFDPDAKAMYVSHLAVLPTVHRMGIGGWCMVEIEALARKEGCTSVRLDAYEKYIGLLDFYKKLDYNTRKVIDYQNLRLVCLEKLFK